jgi:FKBP-type peptidyl-prolyl cis-trans isomerase SlpA
MAEQVGENSEVLMHFILKLDDGSTAESTHLQGKPALFRLGDGSLSDALEQHLLGLRCGDKVSFSLPPESAFGNKSPDLVQFFSESDFLQTGIPDAGTIMMFTAADGSELPGLVQDVNNGSVTVDFNHPLAGQNIHFEIDVLQIDPQQEDPHASFAG